MLKLMDNKIFTILCSICFVVSGPIPVTGFDHWKIVVNGGNGFQIEPKPIGSHPVENFADCDIVGKMFFCISPSYILCSVYNTVKTG